VGIFEFFFLDEKGPCPGSIHIERNHQGLQPKVNEFKSENKIYQTTRPKPQSKLTPPVLRTHYRTTKGPGIATQRVTQRGSRTPANYSTTWMEWLSSGLACRKASDALPPCLAVDNVERQEDTHSKSWQVSFLAATMDF
jgi:hypothetical protein